MIKTKQEYEQAKRAVEEFEEKERNAMVGKFFISTGKSTFIKIASYNKNFGIKCLQINFVFDGSVSIEHVYITKKYLTEHYHEVDEGSFRKISDVALSKIGMTWR